MDPFTQMLLERTKASRNKLEAKLSNTPQPMPRKRRSPLQDDNILVEKELPHNDDADDSPGKRQCVEVKSKADNSKENKTKLSLETRSKPISSPGNGKLDIKNLNRVSNNSTSNDVTDGDNKQKRGHRLAKLAAQINSWEDDVKGHPFSESCSAKDLECNSTKDIVEINVLSAGDSHTASSTQKGYSTQKTNAEEPRIEPPKFRLRVSKSPVKSVTYAENARSPKKVTDIEYTRSSKQAIDIENARSPKQVAADENARSPKQVAANENARSPKQVADVENARSPPRTPKAMPRRRSSSFSVSSSQPARQLDRKKSFSAEKHTTTKTIIWDQAVVATLEAQGYVQSPSRSKLEYKFHSAPVTPRKNISDSDSSDETESDEDDTTPPRVEAKKSPIKTSESGRISVKQLAEKFAAPFAAIPRGSQRDPAELPLSARVALFEKAGQSQASSSLTGSHNKAATFINSNKHRVPNPSPPKVLSQPVVRETQPVVENKSRHSPTKPVGAHTFQLHRQLFEHSQNWKDNEICLKLKEDREKDMEVVLNRWSYKNKKAAENAALVVTSQRVATQPVVETQKLVRAPSVKEPPVPPPLPPATRVSFAPTVSDSSDDAYSESLSETESDDEALKDLEPPLDSEEEINRALAVVDAICTEDEDETDLDSSILKEAFEKIQSTENDKRREEKSVSSFKVPTVIPRVPIKQQDEFRSDDEHSDSLLHTISFYRRQKEMSRHTVLKNIVRNEFSSTATDSKSSTDEDESSLDSHESVQEKIKLLQNEVVVQQAVMRQASQALILCRSNEAFQGSLEQIEGERLLLVSAQKRQACVSEIERIKTDGALGAAHSSSRCSRGSLSMGDMKLVLKREFLEQTANGAAGDFVHFFIILIKHRAQVIATQMMSTMDGISAAALHFPNLINIRELDREFNVIVEVYGLQTKRDCVNRDFKTLSNKKDKSKLTLTPKKRHQSKKDMKMASPKVQSPGGPNVICTSSFALIGYMALNLKNLNRKSWNLEKIPYVSPLEGTLVMKVRCFSDFSTEEQGFLTMFDDVGGFGAWHRRWFVLSDRVLSYWKYPDDVKQKAPIGQIDLCQCITSDVCLVARDICARPHTFMLLIVRPPSKDNTDSLIVHNFKSYATIKVLLSADTKEERILWCQHMNKALENLRTWDPEALRPMPEKFEII